MLILIVGITGSLGQRLANAALSRGLQVRGFGRTPDKLAAELTSKLESFVRSESYYDIPAIEKALVGVDAVINAYAPTPILDLDGQLILLRAAERAQVKVFIASAWNFDWTNLKFGDFEYYNTKIALEHHVASTSSIKPVWILCGQFSDLLWTQYGAGGWDTTGERPSKKYWGNGVSDKFSWITQDDCAEWTIDTLLYGDGVLDGKGGIFKFHSGTTSINDLAATYEEVHGTKVDLVHQGSIDDLKARLAEVRKIDRAGWFGYFTEAAAMVNHKGDFVNSGLTVLDQFRKPTSLADALRAIKQ